MFASYLYVDVCQREGSASVTEFFPKTPGWDAISVFPKPKNNQLSGEWKICYDLLRELEESPQRH